MIQTKAVRLLVLPLLLSLVAAPQAAGQREKPIKVDVNLVLVNAAVTDRRGRPVTGLEKTDFQIWEDKFQQDIRYFSAEETPASIAVVLDISGSMANKLPLSKEAVSSFLQTGGPHDEYTLIDFSNRPEVAQDFTSNISEVQRQVVQLSPSGYTALYDAVYLGLETLRHAHNRRKALLVITDGEDNRSHYNINDVKELAKEADVQLFAIGTPGLPGLKLGTSMIDARKGTHRPGQDVLQEMVDLTGGQMFFTRNTQELNAICTRISESLRSEYIIGYTSTNAVKDGRWRKLHLKVNEVSHVTVRARSGYYASVQ
jgi:Ca-activated chloride channel family protein